LRGFATVRIALQARVSAPWSIATTAVILGWRFFHLIWQYSVNVLYADQWDFLQLLFRDHPPVKQLFLMQQGPHREGIGLLADWALYSLTGWNVRVESFFLGICIFTAMLLALVLKRRLFGSLSYADVAIPILFLRLAQWETVLSINNPSYSALPLLLLVAYCLALLDGRRWRKYAVVLTLNFLLIYTGFGFFIGPVTLGVFLFECYRNWRGLAEGPLALPVIGLAIAAASFASFFNNWSLVPAVSCYAPSWSLLPRYAEFVGLMFANFLGLVRMELHPAAIGMSILIATGAVLTNQLGRQCKPPEDGRRATEAPLIASVLLLYSVLFAASTAVGRLCLGLPGAAFVSRYTTLLIPGFLAVYFAVLAFSSEPIRRRAVALFLLVMVPGGWWQREDARYSLAISSERIRKGAAVLFLLAIIPGAWLLREEEARRLAQLAEGKRAWADCYIQTEKISACDQSTGFAVYSDPERGGLQEKLDFLKRHHLSLFSRP
jgi:hypothetical protein